MANTLLILLSCVIFIGVVIVVDAAVGLARRYRGVDEDAVERRLAAAATTKGFSGAPVDILRSDEDVRTWQDYLPFFKYFQRLLVQSGTKKSITQLVWTGAVISGVIAIFLILLLPGFLTILSIPIGVFCGAGAIILYLSAQRSKRVQLFEEQLPDAIDLMVRSLRVGHPLSSAIGVIGREMSEPVAGEFAIAAEQVSYGKSIPRALAEVQERMPVNDLSYLVVVVQIQEESGGNLVESLSKLSTVIRERFRMFRKAHAITAEGRISAWLLSFFPFGIAAIISIIKPDYYTQVMDYEIFPTLLIITIVLLIVNIFAMRWLTTLKI